MFKNKEFQEFARLKLAEEVMCVDIQNEFGKILGNEVFQGGIICPTEDSEGSMLLIYTLGGLLSGKSEVIVHALLKYNPNMSHSNFEQVESYVGEMHVHLRGKIEKDDSMKAKIKECLNKYKLEYYQPRDIY